MAPCAPGAARYCRTRLLTWLGSEEGSALVVNRTVGSASVVPELVYDDVGAAVDWLCETFGFTEMWATIAPGSASATGSSSWPTPTQRTDGRSRNRANLSTPT